jgi:hypothetical protein
MATSFPSGLDALTNPTSSDGLNSPDHAGQHADANDAIEALEAKVGVNGSAVTSSLDYKITNINASNLASGTVPTARISGSYTGITSVGTLTGLTIGGAGANRSITINAPTGYYAIQYFAINGTDRWHYEVQPDGTKWSLVQSGVAERIGVTSTGATFSGTVTATTFSGSGSGLTSLNASNLSSGTVASACISGSYTGITGVGSLTSLTTTGQITMDRGALGTTSGNSITFLNPSATTTNADILDTRLIRNSSGSDWTTAIWRIGRLVDSTRMGFIQFGDGAGGQDVRFGVGTTTYGIITTGGLSVSSNIAISASGSNFTANNPSTGTGNAAQWVSAFGTYILHRNTSTRDDKENLQPLNGIVTPSMIDDIDISLWNRKGATGFPEIGPMAEDMDEVSPFLSIRGMDCDEEGNIVPTAPSGINQNSWLSLLTLGIQDLRKRVQELETV